ncbi:flagellar hook-length control protein FliK, partial [Teichococcus deserti]|uniref:flagellar hook-length control protein FliK n=1 Tax=Teichococcus deserti TaxID=1817963 RepID=UPI0010546147
PAPPPKIAAAEPDAPAEKPAAAAATLAPRAADPGLTPPVLAAPAPGTTPAQPVLVPQAAAAAHPRLAAEAAPQIALHLARAAEDGKETVSVELRPPELGRVELRLTFRDGQVQQVVMAAERVETFEALRQDRSLLLQQMEQAGLQLGQSGLDLQHGRSPQQQAAEGEARPYRLADTAEEAAGEAAAAGTAGRRPPSDSLIDIIA